MKLESVPHGFRDIYQGVADEPVENPVIAVVSGNSTAAVELTDPKTIKLTINGDGDIANTAITLTVDGHIGDGEVPLVFDFDWDTISPDATSVSSTKVTREPIPAS